MTYETSGGISRGEKSNSRAFQSCHFSAGYEVRYEGVRKIRSVHPFTSTERRCRGETRKGMNADGTGKVFDGLWDRGHVEGRLYNFP